MHRVAARPVPPRRRWRRRLLCLALGLFLLPWVVILAMRWIDPPTTAFMLSYRWASGLASQQQWRPLAQIAPTLQLAVIAAEDQRFPDHHGFDVAAIRETLAADGTQGRGASTISQQLAKNLFLWSGRSLLRKGLEAGFAAMIEVCWPKRRILEVYLNVVEFGPGIYGAEAAAQHHFGRAAADLDGAQASLLAAVLPNPKRYSATSPGPYLQQRARWIRRQMAQLGGDAYLQRLP